MNAKIRGLKRIPFVIFITASLCVVAVSFNMFYVYIEEKDIIWYPFVWHEDFILQSIMSIIFGPLFETWFTQSLPYRLLVKVRYLNNRKFLILLISAIFFGLNHFYSLFYMVYAFLMGLVLMYGYMVRIKTDNKTFYLIAISHSIINLMVFIRNLFIV